MLLTPSPLAILSKFHFEFLIAGNMEQYLKLFTVPAFERLGYALT